MARGTTTTNPTPENNLEEVTTPAKDANAPTVPANDIHTVPTEETFTVEEEPTPETPVPQDQNQQQQQAQKQQQQQSLNQELSGEMTQENGDQNDNRQQTEGDINDNRAQEEGEQVMTDERQQTEGDQNDNRAYEEGDQTDGRTITEGEQTLADDRTQTEGDQNDNRTQEEGEQVMTDERQQTEGDQNDNRTQENGDINDNREQTEGEQVMTDDRTITEGEQSDNRNLTEGDIADERQQTEGDITDSRTQTEGDQNDNRTQEEGEQVMTDERQQTEGDQIDDRTQNNGDIKDERTQTEGDQNDNRTQEEGEQVMTDERQQTEGDQNDNRTQENGDIKDDRQINESELGDDNRQINESELGDDNRQINESELGDDNRTMTEGDIADERQQTEGDMNDNRQMGDFSGSVVGGEGGHAESNNNLENVGNVTFENGAFQFDFGDMNESQARMFEAMAGAFSKMNEQQLETIQKMQADNNATLKEILIEEMKKDTAIAELNKDEVEAVVDLGIKAVQEPEQPINITVDVDNGNTIVVDNNNTQQQTNDQQQTGTQTNEQNVTPTAPENDQTPTEQHKPADVKPYPPKTPTPKKDKETEKDKEKETIKETEKDKEKETIKETEKDKEKETTKETTKETEKVITPPAPEPPENNNNDPDKKKEYTETIEGTKSSTHQFFQGLINVAAVHFHLNVAGIAEKFGVKDDLEKDGYILDREKIIEMQKTSEKDATYTNAMLKEGYEYQQGGEFRVNGFSMSEETYDKTAKENMERLLRYEDKEEFNKLSDTEKAKEAEWATKFKESHSYSYVYTDDQLKDFDEAGLNGLKDREGKLMDEVADEYAQKDFDEKRASIKSHEDQAKKYAEAGQGTARGYEDKAAKEIFSKIEEYGAGEGQSTARSEAYRAGGKTAEADVLHSNYVQNYSEHIKENLKIGFGDVSKIPHNEQESENALNGYTEKYVVDTGALYEQGSKDLEGKTVDTTFESKWRYVAKAFGVEELYNKVVEKAQMFTNGGYQINSVTGDLAQEQEDQIKDDNNKALAEKRGAQAVATLGTGDMIPTAPAAEKNDPSYDT